MVTSPNIPQLIIRTAEGDIHLRLAGATNWTFGRSDDNTVQLTDTFASRRHAMIQAVEGDRYFYTDLNSRNGSLFNGQPVTKPILLRHGDHITIGNTQLLFEHCPNIEQGITVDPTTAQVYMLHGSKLQGEIWQKVLESQGISVLWAESSEFLRQTLVINEATATLPKLLLIDLKLFSGNPYPFCRWCHQSYPETQIFLMDSLRQNIPKLERQIAIKYGVLDLLPAMSRSNLILRTSEILESTNKVLSVLGIAPLTKSHFLLVLRTIEDLIGHTFSDQIPLDTVPNLQAEVGVSRV